MTRSLRISQRKVVALFSIAIVGLIVTAGILTVSRMTNDMALSAETRLDTHLARRIGQMVDLVENLSSDIRLARQDSVFDEALGYGNGQLNLGDRVRINDAISYFGKQFLVDEICVIRANGLETARWVGGVGVAPIESLSHDERPNNPAVDATVPLPNNKASSTSAS